MNLSPLFLSIKIATISTCFVFIFGVALARILSRKDFIGKSILESIVSLPLVLPPTVIGFGLLYFFGKNGPLGKILLELFHIQIIFTWVGAVIAAIIVSFPLMYQNASAAFLNYDRKIENAARTMGASNFKVFWTISFPLAWPGLLAGLILTFARALGEFGATLMIAGYIPNKTVTIPIAIYFAVESGNVETVRFWIIIIILIGFSAIMWLNWWSKHNLMKYK